MLSGFATMMAIAIASNLDNAGVGIAYGVRRIHISWLANGMIGLISGVATFVSGFIGQTVTEHLPERAASWIGALIMFAVGVWVMIEPLRSRAGSTRPTNNMMTRILRDPVEADFDQSQTIGLGEAAILGIALAINALAGGFDAGIVHIGIGWTAAAVAVFSYALLGLSAFVGRRYAARTLGNKATLIAGLLLILVGIHQVL